jgi:hypothetical protein
LKEIVFVQVSLANCPPGIVCECSERASAERECGCKEIERESAERERVWVQRDRESECRERERIGAKR